MNSNPLICDPVDGTCGIPERPAKTRSVTISTNKPLKMIYFTDPICSACWAIEPQLRKLKLEYGKNIDIEYRMGGLLPNWHYDDGIISQPLDVARHWDEMSIHYDMPIDGDVWIDNPLSSSFPPSIAFKAAQMQDNTKALLFLRKIREMVFLQKKNIAEWAFLAAAAQQVGLDIEQLKTDFEGRAQLLFEEDLQMTKSFGVSGFPTIFFIDNAGNKDIVYGSKPYAFYEMVILKLAPATIKSEYSRNWETLFSIYHSLTAKEFSELSGTPRIESEKQLNELTEKGFLKKMTTRNGAIWSVKH